MKNRKEEKCTEECLEFKRTLIDHSPSGLLRGCACYCHRQPTPNEPIEGEAIKNGKMGEFLGYKKGYNTKPEEWEKEFDKHFLHCPPLDTHTGTAIHLQVFISHQREQAKREERERIEKIIIRDCFVTRKGTLRRKTIVVDGKQYYKNVSVDDLLNLLDKEKK